MDRTPRLIARFWRIAAAVAAVAVGVGTYLGEVTAPLIGYLGSGLVDALIATFFAGIVFRAVAYLLFMITAAPFFAGSAKA